jgi:hypothetical protein
LYPRCPLAERLAHVAVQFACEVPRPAGRLGEALEHLVERLAPVVGHQAPPVVAALHGGAYEIENGPYFCV